MRSYIVVSLAGASMAVPHIPKPFGNPHWKPEPSLSILPYPVIPVPTGTAPAPIPSGTGVPSYPVPTGTSERPGGPGPHGGWSVTEDQDQWAEYQGPDIIERKLAIDYKLAPRHEDGKPWPHPGHHHRPHFPQGTGYPGFPPHGTGVPPPPPFATGTGGPALPTGTSVFVKPTEPPTAPVEE